MTTPQPFLQTIARQYVRRYRGDLSRFCFIFPGRRSGTFFIKYLNETLRGTPMIAPQTLTITDFNYSMADRIPDNRFDLLFLLYRCYLDVLGMNPDDENAIPFDQFRSWGETVLSDFNDIDSHLVNPDEIFKNLKDFNEISTDFLTEEQREVMKEYFGMDISGDNATRFWKSYTYTSHRDGSTHHDSDIKDRFLYLWQTMGPLYHRFVGALAKEGLAYDGLAARLCLEVLKKSSSDDIEPKKLVFVGFNVLTTAEWQIFKCLKRMKTRLDGQPSPEPFADFVWDMTGVIMTDEYSAAMKYVRNGIQHFPKPDWLDLSESEAEGIPAEVTVISAPSNAIQAKITGAKIKTLHGRLTQETFDEARVAVVLPDEGLLLPLVNSLPETMVEVHASDGKGREIRRAGVNLTMGLPLRHTPVVSFVNLLRRLQTRLRDDRRHPVYYYEDVEALLAHPFTHILLSTDTVMNVIRHIRDNHLKYIPEWLFSKNGPNASAIFHRVAQNAPLDTIIDYIDSLLELVDKLHEPKEAADGKNPEVTFDSLTHTHIDTYRRALRRLRSACHKRGIKPGMNTLFLLADRLISGEKVMFEGQPVSGLQIMGMLETRSLDFEHIIIPSMNERIFPRRMHTRTFIPASLRTAYGLPSAFTQESVMAYYFYRLICRARSLVMIYDARNTGTHPGDPSRFVLQMQHLYARDRIKLVGKRFILPRNESPEIVVEKDATVMERLNRYLSDDNEMAKRLSASSLQRYFSCPLSFYFRYIKGLDLQEPPSEFMTAIDLGNVVHDTMMRMYIDDDQDKIILPRPQPVSSSVPGHRVSQLVRQAINTQYLKRPRYYKDSELTGEPKIQQSMIETLIKRVLKLDAKYAGLQIHGCEIDKNIRLQISPELTVNFNMKIDRLDSYIDPESGERVYRIVDYKTGTVHVEADDWEQLFSIDENAKYLFQLLMYCTLARRLPELQHISRFQPVIYDVNKGTAVSPTFGLSGSKNNKGALSKKMILSDTDEYYTDETLSEKKVLIDTFAEELEQRLSKLFDKEEPFRQTADTDHCKYCDYRAICRR